MKINDKAAAALQDPDTQAVSFEMTPERREQFKLIGKSIIDILRANTRGPLEAYSILHFLMQGFEESYGIRGGIVMEHSDKDC
jgi:exonuclease III